MSKGLYKFVGHVIWDILKIIGNKIDYIYNLFIFFSGSTFIFWFVLKIFAVDEMTVILSLLSWWLLIFLSYGLLTVKTKIRMGVIKGFIFFMYHKFGNTARLIGSTIVILLFIVSFFNKFSFVTRDFLNIIESSEAGLHDFMLVLVTIFIVLFGPLVISMFILAWIVQAKFIEQNRTLSKISPMLLALFLLFMYAIGIETTTSIAVFLDNNIDWIFTISLFGLHLN